MQVSHLRTVVIGGHRGAINLLSVDYSGQIS